MINILCPTCFVLKKHKINHLKRIMKLSIFLFFCFVCSAIAKDANSQNMRITLNKQNVTIREILEDIEQQTEYLFIYNKHNVNTQRKVSLTVSNKPVTQILSELFQNTDISYILEGKHIVLTTKNEGKTEILNTQQNKRIVTGIVKDKLGETVIGANISVKGTTIGTITDIDGKFSIEVPEGALIQVSYIGFLSQEFPIGNKNTFDIVLQEDTQNLQEVVVVGYGTQKKVTLTGAVSAVNTDDLIATKTENIQNALTGKIPGVRVVQKTSEPGVFSNAFDIRGFGTPLIVIDGIPRDNYQRLDPNDIESISVLKDASAAIYGVRAANGVVLITTKKGKEGKLELNYSGNYGIQTPSGLPKTVGAVDWLTLMNEKAMHSATNTAPPPYTQEYRNEYRNGARKSTDWYPAVIQNSAPQTQHNLSASGSTDKIDYFISMGYLYQEGFFKSGDLNYERYNVRSNVTAKISKYLTAELKISGILDERQQPGINGSREIFKSLWRMDPIRSIYANDNPQYLGYIPNVINPIALSNSGISGYKKSKNNWFQGSFGLTYDIPFIKGLTAKGVFSYDYRTETTKTYKKNFNLYEYDEATDTYKSHINQNPPTLNRTFSEAPNTLLQISLNYNRTFAEKHNIGALILFEEQTKSGDNFYAQRDLVLSGLDELLGGGTNNQIGNMNANGLFKTRNKGFVGRLNYDYNSKYIAEVSFRYDGSSKFPKGKQWGFFPAVSAGWRLSEENFIKNNENLSFINNLKLRASYGVMGDDGASSYQFISGYTFPQPAGGNNVDLQGGYVFGGDFAPSVGYKNLPNNNITWYEVKTANIGFDADLWNGLFGIQLDIFNRKRDGLLATRRLSLPGTLGAALPQENMNSDRVRGLEVALNHRNKIGEFTYQIGGNISFTKMKWLDYDQAEAGNSYDYWRNTKGNRNPNIAWGLDYEGQFQNYDDIYGCFINHGESGNNYKLPGDYKYSDWNGDGVINDDDRHPIGSNFRDWDADGVVDDNQSVVPNIYYGIDLSGAYKGFDLNLMFQGAASVWMSYPEQLSMPLMWDGNALEYFTDRWHPVDPMADPYNPSTQWVSGYYSYTANTRAKGKRNMQNASYLRLKTIELGYTFPKAWVNKLGIQNLRVYVNGYNLLTITGVKNLDPEKPGDENGYLYPLNKTYNFGLNITL